jgi:hypothetical protein
MSTAAPAPSRRDGGFDHAAFLYAGVEGFLAGTAAFVREGLAAGEPVMVAVDATKAARLREHLPDTGRVRWVDITRIGANPARITSLWLEFMARAGGGALRGVGEPIWPFRSPAELVECQRHEELLNLAFADQPRFRLLCPYDTQALEPAVVAEARRSHPMVVEGSAVRPSTDYRGLAAAAAPFEEPLPEPRSVLIEPGVDGLPELGLFGLVRAQAADAGLGPAQAQDLAVAVLAADGTLRPAGGRCALRLWQEDRRMICELRTPRVVRDPLAGRHPPSARPESRGHWLANQLCDLVELRSFPTGTVARLHIVV